MQTTLKHSIHTSGIGLHTGKTVNLAIHPAEAGHGIVFVRTDMKGNNVVPALWNYVTDTQLCTVISNKDGARIGTIEHLMAALRGCGIDNATIELDAPEVPVMDGSAAPFVALIDEAGIVTQNKPRRAIRVLKEITIEQDGKRVTLSPSEDSVFSGEINYDHTNIGTQRFETKLMNGNFRHDIADARTFGFLHEVEFLRKNGLALGGSFDNAIVLNHDGVMNPGGLRYKDEFIRHKILDAIGDLYLAGGRILGAYDGSKAGHALNNAVLRALFARPDAWEMVDLDEEEGDVFAASTEEELLHA
jgi:UDP-3-O-[3-hydroxymyristoyl] N-acetylglucosamine deacetylase